MEYREIIAFVTILFSIGILTWWYQINILSFFSWSIQQIRDIIMRIMVSIISLIKQYETSINMLIFLTFCSIVIIPTLIGLKIIKGRLIFLMIIPIVLFLLSLYILNEKIPQLLDSMNHANITELLSSIGSIFTITTEFKNLLIFFLTFCSIIIIPTLIGLKIIKGPMMYLGIIPIVLTMMSLYILKDNILALFASFMEAGTGTGTGTGTNFTPKIDIADFIKTCYKSTGMLLLIIFFAVIFYYVQKDPVALTKNAYKYIFPIFIPLLLLFGYYIQQNTETSIVGLIVACLVALVVVYIQTTMSKTAMTGVNMFLKYLLLPIICMIGLAIAYKPLSEYTYGLTGWSKFIMELIFYIPCLILDFFEYLKEQYKITPNVVYILFVIEILLILLYIYIPKLLKLKLKSKGKTLLNEPVFLNKEKIIGNSSITSLYNPNNIMNKNTYKTNYAISLWVHLNTQSTSNAAYAKETTIFEYGSIDPTGKNNVKPRIAYKADNSGDKYIFYFTKFDENDSNTKFELSLPTQKWNHIVLNYYDTRADLHVNGKLERTYTFDGNMPTYSSSDVFKVGSEQGLDGAICSVDYFAYPLKETDIVNMYNMLVIKSPPVE